jgi:FixJ family two-component response regulator
MRLTQREEEVLAQLVAGLTNREIAQELGISARTVETHRGRVMHKMGCRRLADLVRKVVSGLHHEVA